MLTWLVLMVNSRCLFFTMHISHLEQLLVLQNWHPYCSCCASSSAVDFCLLFTTYFPPLINFCISKVRSFWINSAMLKYFLSWFYIEECCRHVMGLFLACFNLTFILLYGFLWSFEQLVNFPYFFPLKTFWLCSLDLAKFSQSFKSLWPY